MMKFPVCLTWACLVASAFLTARASEAVPAPVVCSEVPSTCSARTAVIGARADGSGCAFGGAIRAVRIEDLDGEPEEGEDESSCLPSEYVRVEYVASTVIGKQYFDTGILGQRNLKVVAKLAFDDSKSSGYAAFLGSYNTIRVDPIYVNLGTWALGAGDTYKFNVPVVVGTIYDVVAVIADAARGGSLTLCADGGEAVTYRSESAPNVSVVGEIGSSGIGRTLYCFCRNDENAPQGNMYFIGRCYGLSIAVGGELKADYVPCRKASVAGMFDRVTRTFKTSAGEKGFEAGPDVEIPLHSPVPRVAGEPVEPEKVFESARTDQPVEYSGRLGLDSRNDRQSVCFGDDDIVEVPRYYTARIIGNTAVFTLNAHAIPKIGKSDGGDAFKFVSDKVILSISNAQKGLWYGVSCSTSVQGPWLRPDKWILAGEDGLLEQELEATKRGDRCFYRVIASDIPMPPEEDVLE